MRSLQTFVTGALVRIAAVAFVVLIALTLVRYAPGFDVDERELDPSLSIAAREAARAARAPERQVLNYMVHLTQGALHGDLGTSETLATPVRELVSERSGATLQILVIGLALAWLGGFAWALVTVALDSRVFSASSSFLNSALLCVPTAVLAALAAGSRIAPPAVLAAALLPKVFYVAAGLLREASQHPEILAAHARGLTPARVFARHIVPRITAPFLAFLVGSVSIAVGAMVPIEALCDVPGLGQLAWKAALGRDMPLLAVLTFLVAATVQLSNLASVAAGRIWNPEAA